MAGNDFNNNNKQGVIQKYICKASAYTSSYHVFVCECVYYVMSKKNAL